MELAPGRCCGRAALRARPRGPQAAPAAGRFRSARARVLMGCSDDDRQAHGHAETVTFMTATLTWRAGEPGEDRCPEPSPQRRRLPGTPTARQKGPENDPRSASRIRAKSGGGLGGGHHHAGEHGRGLIGPPGVDVGPGDHRVRGQPFLVCEWILFTARREPGRLLCPAPVTCRRRSAW